MTTATHTDLSPADAKPGTTAGPSEWGTEVFDYHDAAGALAFKVAWTTPPAGRGNPRPRLRTPDGTDAGSVPLVLYRLPELVAALVGELVFITEAEKACEAVRGLGLVATTNPMGAGEWPRRDAAASSPTRPRTSPLRLPAGMS
ncbi:MAG: hypothetical protein FJZ01_14855 [Candidatus Sericytochromatia bacterium]|nr:hypothetical protein [Candidatus Tanganyikabacteria bacterium]